MITNFVKLYEDAYLPVRATKKSAGYDLFTPKDLTIAPGEQVLVTLGITWNPVAVNEFAEPIDFFGLIREKSGKCNKLRLTTRAGVIDSDYPDEWGVILVNEGQLVIKLTKGEAIAQVIFLEHLVATDLVNELVERDGGFGSTGK